MQLSRRGFLGVLAGALAAPIVVKAANIMPVRALDLGPWPRGFVLDDLARPGDMWMRVSGWDWQGNVIQEEFPWPTSLSSAAAPGSARFKVIDQIGIGMRVGAGEKGAVFVEDFVIDESRMAERAKLTSHWAPVRQIREVNPGLMLEDELVAAARPHVRWEDGDPVIVDA